MNYNFCILSSKILKVVSPTTIVIRQKFPIQYNPLRVGKTLMVMNDENTVIGSAKIARYKETPQKVGSPILPGGRYCPQVTVTLRTPIKGLQKGLHVWSKEAANPDTTLKNCTAVFSIRMQTSLTIENCIFTCYNVAYGFSPRHKNVEGPGPKFMRITNSEFRIGRGSGMTFQCGGNGPVGSTRIGKIHIENSTFHAPLRIAKAEAITLLNNRFHGAVSVGKHSTLKMAGNQRDGKAFTLPGGLNRSPKPIEREMKR